MFVFDLVHVLARVDSTLSDPHVIGEHYELRFAGHLIALSCSADILAELVPPGNEVRRSESAVKQHVPIAVAS